jgi:hypothetical protein
VSVKTDYKPGDRVRVVTEDFEGLPPGTLGTVRPWPSGYIPESDPDYAFLKAVWPLPVHFDNQPVGKLGNDFFMVAYEEVEPAE